MTTCFSTRTNSQRIFQLASHSKSNPRMQSHSELFEANQRWAHHTALSEPVLNLVIRAKLPVPSIVYIFAFVASEAQV